MDDNKSLLDQVFDIGDKLYREMCAAKPSDHATLFHYVTELGRMLTHADRASFWKWDRHRHELWTTSATGVDRIIIPDHTGLVGKAIKEKRVVVTNDPYHDPDFNSSVDRETGYVTKSVLVMPVADINGDFIGAFQIINKLDGTGFDETEDVRKLSVPAMMCGIALESETFLEESHHDRLTKLKNRMGFYSDFSRRFAKTLSSGRPLSMFMGDIDKFKRINDTYGHNAGDDVLSHVASVIAKACTEKDECYRWGGEEFIMLMEETTLAECIERTEKIRVALMAETVNADGNIIGITMSFGCCQFDPSKTIEENVSVADGFLYTAKESGRNRVVFE